VTVNVIGVWWHGQNSPPIIWHAEGWALSRYVEVVMVEVMEIFHLPKLPEVEQQG
jgi:hypothetical protein